MLDLLIQNTIVTALQEINFRNPQVAWVVKPWTYQAETGEGQFTGKVVPVADMVTIGDCEVQDCGMYIVQPHKTYSHLITISQESDIAYELSATTPQRRGTNFDVDISVNVWINTHAGTTSLVKANIIKVLQNQVWKDLVFQWENNGEVVDGYDITLSKVRCTLIREKNGNPFEQYNFGDDFALQNNSYAAFSLVFKVTGIVLYACAPGVPDYDVFCSAQIPGGFFPSSPTFTGNYSAAEQVWPYSKDTDGKVIYWKTFIWGTGSGTTVSGLQSISGFTGTGIHRLVDQSLLRSKSAGLGTWSFSTALIVAPFPVSGDYTITLPNSQSQHILTLWYTKP